KLAEPSEASAVSARFEDVDLPFYPVDPGAGGKARSFEAVLGVPFNHPAGSAHVALQASGKSLELPFTIVPGNYRSEQLKVDERRVNPRPRDLKRIKREVKLVSGIYREVTRDKLWKGHFQLPID